MILYLYKRPTGAIYRLNPSLIIHSLYTLLILKIC